MKEQRASKQAALAEVNLRIREAVGDSLGEEQEWEFFCECGSDECREHVRLTLDEYSALHDDGCAVVAPSHQLHLREQTKSTREESRALRAEASQLRRTYQRRRTVGRVLVVDDSELVRLTAAEVISAANELSLIGTAASGEEAIQAVIDLKPDLVLLDVRMPGLDGIEATRIIRDTSPNIVVVLFSAEPWPRD